LGQLSDDEGFIGCREPERDSLEPCTGDDHVLVVSELGLQLRQPFREPLHVLVGQRRRELGGVASALHPLAELVQLQIGRLWWKRVDGLLDASVRAPHGLSHGRLGTPPRTVFPHRRLAPSALEPVDEAEVATA
jgi:hypothetical protein